MAEDPGTERAEDRLAELEDDIDSQRRELGEEQTGEDEPKFSDTGVRGPIDDQIAPG